MLRGLGGERGGEGDKEKKPASRGEGMGEEREERKKKEEGR